MSNQASSASSPLKVFLGAMGVFVFFGFLALILSGYAGHESIEDRAYMGEFDAETIQQRWANLEEIEAAQGDLLDEKKVASEMAAIVSSAPKASKSSIVVPGSPTFMKQMEEASAPKKEEEVKAATPKKKEAPKEPSPKVKPEAKPAPKAEPKA
ncbi:MAG: hypothetical protein P1U58_02450, partial [Verrucomicrobiales bacterium]|nr:hypothetical protein [Verrucomicrobiales bacterium]